MAAPPGVPLKSKDRTHFAECPKCHGRDLRGPLDTVIGSGMTTPRYIMRAWFCRTCWWDTAKKLRDDETEREAEQQRSA